MGTYNQSAEQIVDELEKFLEETMSGGEISAEILAEAWNILSKKHEWSDKLTTPKPSWEFHRYDEKVAAFIHYPDCWDTAAYPTLANALMEISGLRDDHECPVCKKEMGK